MTNHLALQLEIKALGDRQFEGHGSVFKNVDLGGDVVMPGAFSRSLAAHRKAGSMPAMFWMHQPDQVPGKWSAMKEDETGLYVKGELVDTQLGNEMHTLLAKQAVRGLSIGYQPVDASWDNDGNRLLKEVDLWEVSIVSLAMNPLAKVEAAKSRLSDAGEYVPQPRELERKLREWGCSRGIAKRIVVMLKGDGNPIDPDLWDADRPRDAEIDDDDELKALEALRGFGDKLTARVLTDRLSAIFRG